MEIKCPPPPPPPPIPLSTPISAPVLQSNLELLKKSYKKLHERDLVKAIRVSARRENSKVFYVTNTLLQPQIQKGATCGLVALSIASLISQEFVGATEIFNEALSKGLTKQGEMFSAKSLAYLAEKCCKFNTRIISGGLDNHIFCILQSLLNKNLLLVPYDCDVDHFPCLKNGIKSHWAVISGFAITTQLEENKNTSFRNDLFLLKDNFNKCDCKTVQNNMSKDTENNLSLINFNEKLYASKKSVENISNFDVENVSKIYFIALQGKSRHFGIWDFNSLAESNDNLLLFSENRDAECYVLPAGGLEEGLKGQAIILESVK